MPHLDEEGVEILPRYPVRVPRFRAFPIISLFLLSHGEPPSTGSIAYKTNIFNCVVIDELDSFMLVAKQIAQITGHNQVLNKPKVSAWKIKIPLPIKAGGRQRGAVVVLAA
jgi:hypothetical protein